MVGSVSGRRVGKDLATATAFLTTPAGQLIGWFEKRESVEHVDVLLQGMSARLKMSRGLGRDLGFQSVKRGRVEKP